MGNISYHNTLKEKKQLFYITNMRVACIYIKDCSKRLQSVLKVAKAKNAGRLVNGRGSPVLY